MVRHNPAFSLNAKEASLRCRSYSGRGWWWLDGCRVGGIWACQGEGFVNIFLYWPRRKEWLLPGCRLGNHQDVRLSYNSLDGIGNDQPSDEDTLIRCARANESALFAVSKAFESFFILDSMQTSIVVLSMMSFCSPFKRCLCLCQIRYLMGMAPWESCSWSLGPRLGSWPYID